MKGPEVERGASYEAPGGETGAGGGNDELGLLPVLVVVHGDSFDYGSGATISGASRFARQNGLLVVTFNFRLNLLGRSTIGRSIWRRRLRRPVRSPCRFKWGRRLRAEQRTGTNGRCLVTVAGLVVVAAGGARARGGRECK